MDTDIPDEEIDYQQRYMSIIDAHEPKVIEEWKAKVNPDLTCFIKLLQGSEIQREGNYDKHHQSLARVTIFHESLHKYRPLSADIGKQNITIQPTSVKTI